MMIDIPSINQCSKVFGIELKSDIVMQNNNTYSVVGVSRVKFTRQSSLLHDRLNSAAVCRPRLIKTLSTALILFKATVGWIVAITYSSNLIAYYICDFRIWEKGCSGTSSRMWS